jgi:hypothetical protein
LVKLLLLMKVMFPLADFNENSHAAHTWECSELLWSLRRGNNHNSVIS